MQKFLWTGAKSTAICSRIRPDPCKRDQSMVESGVIEGGKNTASFFIVNEHNNANTKPQAKKQRFLKLSKKRNGN